jgi:NADH:ubiquinone reductase (non-electrogenic)
VELILGFFATAIKRSPPEGESQPYDYILELMSASTSKRSVLPSMTLPADLIFWTVGSKPSLPSGGLGGDETPPFPLNGKGQVETEDTLRVKGHPRIFAIGDSAFLRDSSGQPFPTTAQVLFHLFFLNIPPPLSFLSHIQSNFHQDLGRNLFQTRY